MPDTVLYIAGAGHSGSTLLSFLLNAHPQMVSVGEETGPGWVSNRGEYPCSCGHALAGCPFWQRVGKEMRARGLEFGPDKWDVRYELARAGLPRHLLCRSLRVRALDNVRDAIVATIPRFGSRIAELNARNAKLIHVILEITGKRIFVSAAKDTIRARYLDRIPDLNVKIVHLVRDSLRYVNSAMTRRKLASPAGPIREWNRNANHVQQVLERFSPDRFIRVRYEDLCSDTEGELARIAEFVGVSPMQGPVRFRDVEHHIIGNRMRLADETEIVLDERWRTQLSPETAKRIEQATRVYRAQFGYASP